MSPLVQRCSRLMCLLTVLWMVGRSVASPAEPPAAGVATALEHEDLVRLVAHDVMSKIQPLVSQLASRMEGLDTRLVSFNTRLNNIEARLNTLDFKQHSFDSRLDGFTSGVGTVSYRPMNNRPDDLASRGEPRLDSKLDELVSRVNFTEHRLDSRLNKLASRVNSTEDRLDSRLDELVSRVDSSEGRLDSRLDELVPRVDSADNRNDPRLDELVSRVDGLASERDRLDSVFSRLDSVSSRLDELANRTDQEQTGRASPDPPPRDCSDLPAGAQSGIHHIQPGTDRSQPPVAAYCDLDTDGGGWTVIQRRDDIEPRQDFNRPWSDYRDGFGQLDAEFWWGLEKVWRLTGPRDRQYQLRVDLGDFDGERDHATYQEFRVASGADGYRLFVAGYGGNAGDSLGKHSGRKFSTIDRDADTSSNSCAQHYKAGWWFYACYRSNLNGQYLPGHVGSGGVKWKQWRSKESLKYAEMKLRPVTTD